MSCTTFSSPYDAYTTADLRRMAEMDTSTFDRRMAATLLALTEQIERAQQFTRTLASAVNGRVGAADTRIDTLEARIAGLAASIERIVQAVPQAGERQAEANYRGAAAYAEAAAQYHAAAHEPEYPHWTPIATRCHDCGNQIVAQGSECSSCTEPVCYFCQPRHQNRCWGQPQPYRTFEEAAQERRMEDPR